MGNWRITIEGHGQHHNKAASDAENLASDFVEQLKRRGHQVDKAEIAIATEYHEDGKHVYGPAETIKPPDATINLDLESRAPRAPVDPPRPPHPPGVA